MEGAITRIAKSLENIDRGIYLNELTTDGNGQVKFEQLLPGAYYIIAGQTRQHEIVFYW